MKNVVCGLSFVAWAAAACSVSAESVHDKFFDSNGVRIHYVDEGQGPPVVLVHGLLSSLQTFVDVGLVANLARDHRVIALDLRGHGKSDKPTEPGAYSGQLTQDIVRLLDHLAIRRAHIVGYSLGGALVAKLLIDQPDRFLTATIGASGGHRLSRLKAETRRDIGDDRNAFAVYYRSGHRDTYFDDDQFAATKVPAQGVVGGNDDNLAGMKELQSLLPGMKLVVIDGATHGGRTNAPGRLEFAEAIRTFVTQHQ